LKPQIQHVGGLLTLQGLSFNEIATCLLRTWGQSDLPLCKGYEEGKKFLEEFFVAT